MNKISKIRNALISVSDKTGVDIFAQRLAGYDIHIISTGGTAAAIRNQGVEVLDVSGVTGFPEMLGGRVKTLHPSLFAGILYKRDNAGHTETVRRHNFHTIELVAVNLYPFANTISKTGVTAEEAIENIDIGGPSLIRAAAKNFESVAVVCDPADYDTIIAELHEHGGTTLETRKRLATKAFRTVSHYDAVISDFFDKKLRIREGEAVIAQGISSGS